MCGLPRQVDDDPVQPRDVAVAVCLHVEAVAMDVVDDHRFVLGVPVEKVHREAVVDRDPEDLVRSTIAGGLADLELATDIIAALPTGAGEVGAAAGERSETR